MQRMKALRLYFQDKKQTLLEYIALVICRDNEDSVTIADGNLIMLSAKQVSFETISTQLKTLKSELETITKKVSRSVNDVISNMSRISSILRETFVFIG